MAGAGRRVLFHGAFKSLERADRKADKVGGYVQEYRIRGRRRYVVMTQRRKR